LAAAFEVWGIWLSRRRRMSAVVMVLVLGEVAWWVTIPPSHDRPWWPEVAAMPRAFVQHLQVQALEVRNVTGDGEGDDLAFALACHLVGAGKAAQDQIGSGGRSPSRLRISGLYPG